MTLASPTYAANAIACQAFREANPGPQNHFKRCEHAVSTHFGTVIPQADIALFEEAPKPRRRVKKSA